ncbi:universal stress protein [Streptomyces sp. HUAS TT20]|uniref:universal stress protein n=1 Tax=Streptomyces sp. HUAS TT20 TaxID=3447509 RepID=UPI002954D623|nr:universal stress protein [Streptomyces sp. HUAS 15-9]
MPMEAAAHMRGGRTCHSPCGRVAGSLSIIRVELPPCRAGRVLRRGRTAHERANVSSAVSRARAGTAGGGPAGEEETMIHPVLAGVDGSEHSLAAAEWAAREAMLRRVPLRVVHAAPPLPGDAVLHQAGKRCAAWSASSRG